MATVNDDGSTTKKTDANSTKHMKNEKISLILWVDGNIKTSEKSSKKLEELAEEVRIIENKDEAIKFLEEKSLEKLIVISSGYLGKGLVPLIHGMKQVEAIYIYCQKTEAHKIWAKDWTKIKGVHDDMLSLQESIQGMSKFNRPEVEHRSPDRRIKSGRNLSLNKLDISFMYTKLFKDTLLELKRSQLCDSDFVETIQKRITKDSQVLSLLLQWTKQHNNEEFMFDFIRSPFFLEVNRALRTFQFEEIINMGFMIYDLHQYIEKKHQEQRKISAQKNGTIFTRQYRSKEDMDKMKTNLGGLFSFNEFLITYAERNVALTRTEQATKDTADTKILFVINFDSTNRSIPFVRIDQKNKDAIVLFSTHTIFRLVTLQSLDNSPSDYEVRLEFTNDTDDEQQQIVNRYFGNATKSYPAWYRIVKLLINLKQFPMAKTFCNIVLKDKTISSIDQAQCYDQLGFIMAQQQAFDDALDLYKKTKKNLRGSEKAEARVLINIFNNMAQIYQDKGDDSNAKKSYESARNLLKIYSFDNDDVEEANVFDHFGRYCERRELSEAGDWFNRSLEKRKKCLPSNHPDFVKSYVNIGRFHEQREEFFRAAIFYEKASSIRVKWLPEYLLKQNRPTDRESNSKPTQQ